MDADREVVVDDSVLMLRGNVVETFHSSGTHHAFHVRHVAVEAKPRKDGDVDVRIGIDVRGTIVDGARMRVPGSRFDEVRALFDEAKRRRG